MKLVLGFDGLGETSLSEFPRFSKALSDIGLNVHVLDEPSNGMWERGWAKLYTGESADKISAYYNRLDKHGVRTAGLDKKACREAGVFWKHSKGIGLYGLPGLDHFPVVGSSTFVVNGAGAGLAPSLQIPRSACDKNATFKLVKTVSPPWEVRVDLFRDHTVQEYIDQCVDYLNKSLEAFVFLMNETNTRDGFFVSRWPDCILGPFYRNVSDGNEELCSYLEAALARADLILEKFVYSIKEHEIIVCSDHDTVPRKGSVNLNALLDGYEPKKKTTVVKKVSYKSILVKILKSVGVSVPRRKYKYTGEAFCLRYVPGLYRGHSNLSRDEWANKYLEKLTNAGVVASSNTIVSVDSRLPDIVVEFPEGYFIENTGAAYLEQEAGSNIELHDLMGQTSDMGGGVKGARAVFACKNNELNDPPNLISAHKILLEFFK